MANIKLLQNIDAWNSWGAVHGFYSLKNDTIITKDFEYMQFAWEMRLMEFKIIDKNTIKFIKRKKYYGAVSEWDASKIAENNVASKNKYIYHFYLLLSDKNRRLAFILSQLPVNRLLFCNSQN